MKIKRIGRILSIVLLLGTFLYSTVVRDLHYIFSVKYHTEAHDHVCDHHIHSSSKEDDCAICKLDVNHIYDHETVVYSFTTVFLRRATTPAVERALQSLAYPTHYLRGPPAIA